MSKQDLWLSIIEAISVVGLFPWIALVPNSLAVPVTPSVKIAFVSSVNPPKYQTKFIIWTLVEAFDYYNVQRHYGNSFLRTYVGRGEVERNLGVGSIRSSLAGKGMNESVLGLGNGTSLEMDSKGLLAVNEAKANFNQSFLENTVSALLQPDTLTTISTLQARPPGLSVWLDYLRPAAIFNDKGFLNLLITTLVFAAQHDPKREPSGLIRSYNSIENYTFVMGPTSDAAKSKLPWGLAIAAMGLLPLEMMKRGPGGRWAELSGRIKLDGAWIGKILILRGDQSTEGVGGCGVGWFGEGGVGDEV